MNHHRHLFRWYGFFLLNLLCCIPRICDAFVEPASRHHDVPKQKRPICRRLHFSNDPSTATAESELVIVDKIKEENTLIAQIPPPANGNSHDEYDKNGVHDGNMIAQVMPPPINGKELHYQEEEEEQTERLTTVRKLWRRRYARSIQEGIRREKTTLRLSSLLDSDSLPTPRKYFARVIAGLIHALAEEAIGLEVDIDARRDTPLWNKHINCVKINFSRLGFQPIRMGGLHDAIQDPEEDSESEEKVGTTQNLEQSTAASADEAFNQIDVDKSGALDSDEIAVALNVVASTDSDQKRLEKLASKLVKLYDSNGDGVVDREEYQRLVEDMAAIRKAQKQREQERQGRKETTNQERGGLRNSLLGVYRFVTERKNRNNGTQVLEERNKEVVVDNVTLITNQTDHRTEASGSGIVILSDLRMDLRRLPFGAIPVIKTITPGGPLFLEPFTATVHASFNKDDVMKSALLDAGLRRLVARALRRRVRSVRDIIDGALFKGRSWNMASNQAPVVEVPSLSSVEFDDEDRLVMTGRARIRAAPTAPVIENAFKVRTKLGTRKNGQVIRLEQPELALVVECPRSWERSIATACKQLGLSVPKRPDPIYGFFPIYSPFKVEDNDGFDLGSDNRIKSIFIKDGALRFELSAVLRPGRFLGSHYLAFSVPGRNFIITVDRVRAAMRSAKIRKREMKKQREQKRKQKGDAVRLTSKQDTIEPPERNGAVQPNKKQQKKKKGKNFFSRFVEGYLGAGAQDEGENERLTQAISDWFGRQGASNDDFSGTNSTQDG